MYHSNNLNQIRRLGDYVGFFSENRIASPNQKVYQIIVYDAALMLKCTLLYIIDNTVEILRVQMKINFD